MAAGRVIGTDGRTIAKGCRVVQDDGSVHFVVERVHPKGAQLRKLTLRREDGAKVDSWAEETTRGNFKTHSLRADPARVVVTRDRIYPQGGNYRFAWQWHYYVRTSPDGRDWDESSVVELRRKLKRAYGRDAEIIETWKGAA